MKRTSLFLAVMLCVPAVWADERAPRATTVNRPIAQVFRAPLHRHPTLFGMLQRNNNIRRRAGLWPHRINPALTAAAQDHANYMARTGQFSHYTNGGPQVRANRYGFRGGVRENIAYGTRSVDGAFNMWTNSGAHYASIVSGTTEAGFGYAVGSSGQVYWVGVYASPSRGDAVGETEQQILAAYAEDAKLKAAEKNVAQDQATDPNVKPASAEAPVANAAGNNPAGNNGNASNPQPGNSPPAEAKPEAKPTGAAM
ncbi:MAG: CAP domain-containing protein [Pirellulaceae bacterium]